MSLVGDLCLASMYRLFAISLVLALSVPFAFGKDFVPKSEGIYAVFELEAGQMVAELYFKKAPKTVANFVGLAEGTLPWYDLESDAVIRKPFYDGLTIHRVVREFIIQTGSPSGSGKDGPGYWFEDEFNKKLRHRSEGILSMANFGPDRNGSQFFITLKEARYLNDKHTMFGKLIRGKSVSSKIGWSRIDKNGKPITPILIKSVRILRVGEEAEAFDPTQFEFPSPEKDSVLARE